MEEIEYSTTTISFPGFTKEDDKILSTKLPYEKAHGGDVKYKTNIGGIDVVVQSYVSYYTPLWTELGLLHWPEKLQKEKEERLMLEMVASLKERLSKEFSSCENQIKEIYKLAQEGKHDFEIFWSIVDRKRPFYYTVNDHCMGKPIEKLYALKRHGLLKPKLSRLVKCVKKEEYERIYVHGASLEKALNNYLGIYNKTKELSLNAL